MPTGYHDRWRHEMHTALYRQSEYWEKREGFGSYSESHQLHYAFHCQPQYNETSLGELDDSLFSTGYLATREISRRHSYQSYQSYRYYSKRPKISEAKWQELEEESQQEQREFLNKYLKEGKFEDVLVDPKEKNVRRGDHIFYQGASGGLYDHHLLCTGVEGDNIHTVEYSGPSFGLSASSRSLYTSNPLTFAEIVKGKITYQELEEKEV